MNEQSSVVFGAAVGAIVGAAAGFLFFTERGRAMRAQIEPTLDDVRRDLGHFQKTVEKAGALALDGLRMVDDFTRSRTRAYPASPVSH